MSIDSIINNQQGGIFNDPFAGMDDALKSAGKFEGLTAGDYTVRITNTEFKKSKTGTPLFTIEYTVIDGEKANRKEWQTLFLKKKDGTWNSNALGDFMVLTKMAGVPSDDLAKEVFKKAYGEFVNAGVDKMQVPGLEMIGTLTIAKTKSNDGLAEFTNYKFKKQA